MHQHVMKTIRMVAVDSTARLGHHWLVEMPCIPGNTGQDIVHPGVDETLASVNSFL